MTSLSTLDGPVASAFYGKFSILRDAQLAAIGPLLNGRNIVLTSGTGSGKTEAVMAPLVSKYWRQAVKSGELFLVYIAPTKALVNDLEKRLYGPLSCLGMRVGVRHGDRDDLTGGSIPHVLITTPESLDVLLCRREPALFSIRALVVDEVHLLYNTQRGLQLSILIKRLLKMVSHELQWAALSATVGDLTHVSDFLVGASENVDYLTFSAQRPIDAQIRSISNDVDLTSLVLRLIEGRETKLLIFVNSRKECEQLSGALSNLESLRDCVFVHYSSLSPQVRLDTERKFSSMRTAICVATSTLELGIDIGDIDVVLLWGVPGGVDSFLQRIGRGNRRSNKTNVICITSERASSMGLEAIYFITLIESARKGELPIRKPYDLFGAVGQQCLSVIVSNGGRFTKISEFCDLIDHKNYLDRATIEKILAELSYNNFLQRHGYRNSYGAQDALHKLEDMKMIYGNFSIGSQFVDIYHGPKCLGSVPSINILSISTGNIIRFAGKHWRVQKLSREGIYLQPSGRSQSTKDFMYQGSGIGIDPFIINKMWHTIHLSEDHNDLLISSLRLVVSSLMTMIKNCCSIDQIPFYRSNEGIRYFTFGGHLVNKAIALASRKVDFKADDISLLVPSLIDWNKVPAIPESFDEFFHALFETSTDQSLYQQMLPRDLQQKEFLQPWLKDTSIQKILRRLTESRPIEVNGEFAEILGY